MTDRPDLDHVEDRIRQWGLRPPATSPAAAARQTVARIANQGPAPRWPRRLAFASAAFLAALALWLVLAQRPRPIQESASVDLPPTLPENVVLFWLDAHTPVYFVTGPADAVTGGLP
ncbi:MAG: hypothetical protein KJ061_17385 [Vicinamibacteraceae bacterium]|nr:hypothetical protein [Vicinamibacteraceae bacterium]